MEECQIEPKTTKTRNINLRRPLDIFKHMKFFQENFDRIVKNCVFHYSLFYKLLILSFGFTRRLIDFMLKIISKCLWQKSNYYHLNLWEIQENAKCSLFLSRLNSCLLLFQCWLMLSVIERISSGVKLKLSIAWCFWLIN